MSTDKKISIVIVTYQSEKDIFDCVDSLLRYADIPISDIEIIIVDNHSNAPQYMFDRLSERFEFPFIFLRNEHNGGYGQGNNIGICHATAPIVMVVNPDVRQTMGYLAAPLQAFTQDRQLIMYGMQQNMDNGQKSNNSFACTMMMNGYLRTILSSLCNRINIFIPKIMHFSGACFFVRKSMFLQVGLFDENNFMYGEEDDIHHRLTRQFGYKLLYNPAIQYLHLTQNRTWSLTYEQKIIESTLYLNEKNGYSRHQSITALLQINKLLRLRARIKMLFHSAPHQEYDNYGDIISYLHYLQLQ